MRGDAEFVQAPFGFQSDVCAYVAVVTLRQKLESRWPSSETLRRRPRAALPPARPTRRQLWRLQRAYLPAQRKPAAGRPSLVAKPSTFHRRSSPCLRRLALSRLGALTQGANAPSGIRLITKHSGAWHYENSHTFSQRNTDLNKSRGGRGALPFRQGVAASEQSSNRRFRQNKSTVAGSESQKTSVEDVCTTGSWLAC